MSNRNYLNNQPSNSYPKVKSRNVTKPYSGQAHTPKSQKGLGDYYGTGFVAKLGRMRDDSMGMQAMTPRQMKTPPKSVV